MTWDQILAAAEEGDEIAKTLIRAIAALSIWPRYRAMGSPAMIYEYINASGDRVHS